MSKKTDPFSSFDFLLKTNFRIFFGFIFVFLLVLLFSVINLSFLASTLLIIALTVIGFMLPRSTIKFRLPRIKNLFTNHLEIVIVFVVSLAILFFSSMLITGFYGSAGSDSADHTLMTRIVLNNPNALLTRIAQPYAYILTYPSGSHVLSAFFITLLDVPIQKIVILLSVVLPVLIAFSFYSTIKCLFNNKLLSIIGLVISAAFTIGISWAPISWGGLPLLLSFYLSISSIGLIFVFLLKNKMDWLNALLLGLIFLITAQTYPVSLLIVTIWFLLILIDKFLQRFLKTHGSRFAVSSLFNKTNITIVFAFIIPILFNVPYFYSIYSYKISGVQFNTLSPGLSSSSLIVKSLIDFNWLIDIPALSRFFSGFGKLLALAPYSLIPLFVLLIPKISKKIALTFPSREFVHSLSLIYFFMLIIMGYLSLTLHFQFNFLTAFLNPERVQQHLFILATIMTAIVVFSVLFSFYWAFRWLFNSTEIHPNPVKLKKLSKNRILGLILFIITILTVAIVSIPTIGVVVSEQQIQYNKIGIVFNICNTLNQSDLSLMKWIAQNVPSEERILVSFGDSGQFVSAIAQKQTISMYSDLTNYSDLMSLLTSNASDLRAVSLMIEYNVSYVYIGSIATTYLLQNPDYRHFNATQFLSTPYFTLSKEIGDAYLFQFNAQTAATAYKNYVTPS
ncbi:MAG: hypothetical protein ABSA79_05670 [Candidatus Bathyarchaeia archaeon]